MYNEDKKLLTEIAAGREQAFRHLFNKYHQRVGSYIVQITGSRELAEEVVQDVFLKLWMNRSTLETVNNIDAYLFVLAKNHALNYLRKLARELKQQEKWKKDPSAAPAADDLPENAYYRQLDEAIDQLPPQQKKVYLLSRHQRLKYAEIAQELNLSRETVKSYLRIATASITAYMTQNSDVIVLFLVFLIFF
ncbi:RNA polymerase sigma-70 factor [Niabella aurantiaca]|uniref:RNA polymerase sigma-70 factor n=1 Tax=Niabella aurantiaca TaxID=379900 RepID=UPI0003619B73|nr:RNA polymerase sigma-70 factor [Niabella aurantiaca]